MMVKVMKNEFGALSVSLCSLDELTRKQIEKNVSPGCKLVEVISTDDPGHEEALGVFEALATFQCDQPYSLGAAFNDLLQRVFMTGVNIGERIGAESNH